MRTRRDRRSESGFVTVEYLFAFVLVCGFSMVIIAFSATLSMVEVTQYIAFAAARNYFAANADKPTQVATAQAKLKSLLTNPLIQPLATGSWFTIDGPNALIGDTVFTNVYNPPDPARNLFEGVMIPFSANILAMQIPFFGSTVKSGQNRKTAFQTNITAFLGREPTFKECNDFNNERWQQIQGLTKNYSNTSVKTVYVPTNDNGC